MCGSFVYKLHIRLPSEPPWKKSKAQIDRIQISIWFIQGTGWIMTNTNHQHHGPDAHEKAKTSFMAELERRAEEFQNS
ncbi:type II toxin-antitoxin system YafO family toxin [Escherichia coli]|nr:type II toxin-antitoxin system YafO family toxin [Escherichia coli]